MGGARANVWIVDDSRLHGEQAKRALAATYNVEVFTDAVDAVERFALAPPDVLIVDWLMPDMSGLEVCRFVRQKRDLAELPILVLTATTERSVLLTAFEVGANDFVRKPFDHGELHARVSRLDASRELHARLNAAEASLRDEALFRERFVAALGHDLRQPLTAIMAAAYALSRADKPAGPKLILGAAMRMGRMIEDVLDLSRARLGGGLVLRPVEASFADIAERVVDEIRAAYPERTILTEVDDRAVGNWDVDRMSRVCSNLLGNAVEHGAQTTPVVLRITADSERVVMVVVNRGNPIPQAARASLFDAFRQGSPNTTTGRGLGLGLFIVDQIVRAHGGAVAVRSDADETAFTVTLPR